MNTASKDFHQKQLYYRLIALWVIIEAFAGGIMHGIKIPFSGLILSSMAMLCIILIAYHITDKNAIIKATITVAIFKFMLSPHSPGTAYIALFFQGGLGQILFINKKYFSIAAVIFCFLGAVESGIQRLLVLLIVYGNEFWQALNQFIHKVTGDHNVSNYSMLLAIAYVLTHAIVGVLTGIYGVIIAKGSTRWKNEYPELIIHNIDLINTDLFLAKKIRRKKYNRVFLLCWSILMILYFYPIFFLKASIIPNNELIKILIRSITIIFVWVMIFSPLAIKFLKKILEKNKIKHRETISAVTKILPDTKAIFMESWKISAQQSGIKRWKLFLKILIINTIR